jgi:hypothetical protein
MGIDQKYTDHMAGIRVIYIYIYVCVCVCVCVCVEGVSRLVDITAGGYFLGLCDQKVRINMCPILDGYGIMTA